MKALLLNALFLCLLNCIWPSLLQAQIVTASSGVAGEALPELQRTAGPLVLQFDSLRLISELSSPGVPEAFPWLSSDGLRVYFTSVNNKGENIMYASRPSLQDPFSFPKQLSPYFMAGSFAATLSLDELEIFFCHREPGGQVSFWSSSRSSLSSNFQAPAEVTLSGIGNGFKTGPSVSANLNELFLYYSENNEPRIFRFARTGSHDFVFTDTIKVPMGFTPVPGQLSKDNLKFLFGRLSGASSFLYEMSRPNLTSPFGTPTRMGGLLGAPRYSGQPSLSADGLTMVFAGSANNTWLGSDLFLATSDTTTQVGVQPLFRPQAANWLSAPYPNPSSGSCEISYQLTKPDANARLLVLAPDGRLLRQEMLTTPAATMRLSTEKLPRGLCYLRIQTAEGISTTQKLVVQ